MSNYNWCHGPTCHEQHTQDRIRGVKGSKVLRTRKLRENHYNQRSIWGYFCSMGCYNDFAKEHMADIIAIAPRTEALETPINVTKEPHTNSWSGQTYMETRIRTVDNNGG
jgi:hypothetical protein